MDQISHSDPSHNLTCRYRFTCGAVRCLNPVDVSKQPSCYVEKFKRYQPHDEAVWYQRDWEDINRITWREVFSLQESWIYTLLVIVVVAFLFMFMVFIKVIFKLN